MVGLLDRDEDGDDGEEDGAVGLGITIDEGRLLLYGSIDGKIDRLLDLRTKARNAISLEEISAVITQLAGEFSATDSKT